MKTEKVFWTDYSVLICTKCQKSITQPTPSTQALSLKGDSHQIDITESIKTRYKTELNDLGYKGKVRVMTSSCLGVCPTGFQAVSVVSTTDPSKSKSYIFDPLTETESVLADLKKSLQSC